MFTSVFEESFCYFVQPPTEKVHQIIARTAMFVGKHGGQSEIILRVKQGDNPTFGFLMPDHHLHPYFRFLVDHQELLKSDAEEKSLEGENTVDGGQEDTGGALSLLGATYGSGEDEDETTELRPELEEDKSKKVDVVTELSSDGLDRKESSTDVAGKERSIPKHPPHSSMKEKASAVKKNRSTSTVKAGAECATKKGVETLYSTAAMKSSSLPSSKKAEQPILEPPSDVKRLVNKIVEFIVKNGEAFESVLIEQDKNHGRFPFLLPSNQYYHYYLKVLQKAQQVCYCLNFVDSISMLRNLCGLNLYCLFMVNFLTYQRKSLCTSESVECPIEVSRCLIQLLKSEKYHFDFPAKTKKIKKKF